MDRRDFNKSLCLLPLGIPASQVREEKPEQPYYILFTDEQVKEFFSGELKLYKSEIVSKSTQVKPKDLKYRFTARYKHMILHYKMDYDTFSQSLNDCPSDKKDYIVYENKFHKFETKRPIDTMRFGMFGGPKYYRVFEII